MSASIHVSLRHSKHFHCELVFVCFFLSLIALSEIMKAMERDHSTEINCCNRHFNYTIFHRSSSSSLTIVIFSDDMNKYRIVKMHSRKMMRCSMTQLNRK